MATKKKQARRKVTARAAKPKITKSTAAKKTSTQAKSSRVKAKKSRKTTVTKANSAQPRLAKGPTTQAVKANLKSSAEKVVAPKTSPITLEKKSTRQPAGEVQPRKKTTSKRKKTIVSAAKLTKKFNVQVKNKPKTKPRKTFSVKASQTTQSQNNSASRSSVSAPNGEWRAKEIGKLAYYKWEAAGCPFGDGVDFWLAAETEFDRAQPSSTNRG